MDTSRRIARNFLPGKARAAFSLVEVVMAIGIVAFAFISVLGMIPTGLSTFRQAMNTSVGSQIAQRVINDAQQMDFLTLSNQTSGSFRYFDDQGNELDVSAQGDAPSNAIYHVRMVVTGSTATPSSSSAGAVNPNLATVKVQVAANPGQKPIAWDGAGFSGVTFAALVSRTNSAP